MMADRVLRHAFGTHARNMHTNIAPYSYGLAARRRRIYNDVACSGGQGVRSSRRMLPLEATRPGLLGTPGLVYSSSHRPSRFSPLARLRRRNHIGKAPCGARSPNPAACRRCWSTRRPGRTPAPCTAVPRCDRIRAVAGSNGSHAQSFQCMSWGKRVEGARFPIRGFSAGFAAFSVPLKPEYQGRQSNAIINHYDSTTF